MLELHDFTHIHTDTTAFNNQILNWWLSAPVLDLIEKHKGHLLLNIANEYGPAMYPAPNYTLNPNYNTEITNWVKHYKSIITHLRSVQITIPIVIDAQITEWITKQSLITLQNSTHTIHIIASL